MTGKYHCIFDNYLYICDNNSLIMAKKSNNVVAGPDLICRTVASDFKLMGITHEDAAKLLGVDKRTVSNQISGKRPFGKKSAHRYAEVFGYDEPYLLYGIGGLRSINDTHPNLNRALNKAIFNKSYDEKIALLTKRISVLEDLVDIQRKQISTLTTKKRPHTMAVSKISKP